MTDISHRCICVGCFFINCFILTVLARGSTEDLLTGSLTHRDARLSSTRPMTQLHCQSTSGHERNKRFYRWLLKDNNYHKPSAQRKAMLRVGNFLKKETSTKRPHLHAFASYRYRHNPFLVPVYQPYQHHRPPYKQVIFMKRRVNNRQ